MTVTDVVLLIALGIFVTLQGAALFLFASTLYTASKTLRDLNLSLTELAIQVKGLPTNIHGLPAATRKIATAIGDHAIQTGALVEVIRANLAGGNPADVQNGAAANWTASIPAQPDFEDGPPPSDDAA